MDLGAWMTPEGVQLIGGLVLLCLFLYFSTKFEAKKTKDDLEKESHALEKLVKDQISLSSIASISAEDRRITDKVTSMLNAHILEGARARAEEILSIGGDKFVLRTTHRDAMGELDAKLHRIIADQASQGAVQAAQGTDIRNLKDQITSLVTLAMQTNAELHGIGTNVAKITGIWEEHVRQHGGLTPLVPQQRNQ